MPNPKTGANRLVPDIRPEHIETFTETYTPEGGEEQTAEYKIFNVDGIIGNILNRMAFWRTHAKAVWYNKLANRTVADEIRDLQDLNAKMEPVVLWENPNTSAGFGDQTVELPDISGYACFDLISLLQANSDYKTVARCYSLDSNYISTLAHLAVKTVSIYTRVFSIKSNNKIVFNAAKEKSLLNTSAAVENNAYVIPEKLIGYKS